MFLPPIVLLALPASLGLSLTLELPREPLRGGETLFARARIEEAAGSIEAWADWQGRRVPLHAEGGSLPIVLAVPLDAGGRATLEVHARERGGPEVSAKGEVEIEAVPAPPAETWEIDPAIAARASASAARAEADSLAAAIALAETPRRLSRGAFESPVLAPRMGRFGARRSINGKGEGGEEAPLHRGIDYALRPRASIRPPAPGIVIATPSLPLLGETVIVSHGQGIASLLAHLESALVKPGDAVTRDSVVGWAGDTGVSDRTMLHYALFVHGLPVDPASFSRMPGWMREPPSRLPDPPATLPLVSLPSPLPAAGASPALPTTATATSTASPTPTPAPAPALPAGPAPTPHPAGTPELPVEIPGEELAGMIQRGIEARLPGTSVAVTLEEGAGRRGPRDLGITIVKAERWPFYTAVEVAAQVVGELTIRTRLRTNRLRVTDAASGQNALLATRDARQAWRESMGLATPIPRDH